MKLKLIVSICLLNFAAGFAQKNIDFFQLSNKWSEGKINAAGQVVQGSMPRGGWYSLQMGSDSSVTFFGASNCGLGHKRIGTWRLNKSDSTVCFLYKEQIAYSVQISEPVSEVEVYKITKVTANELILKKAGQVWAFISE